MKRQWREYVVTASVFVKARNYSESIKKVSAHIGEYSTKLAFSSRLSEHELKLLLRRQKRILNKMKP